MGIFVNGKVVCAFGIAATAFVVGIFEARKRIYKANYEADKAKFDHHKLRREKEEYEQAEAGKDETQRNVVSMN